MSPARASNRKADLARIHLAKKQLALSDDEYRDLLFTLTRQRSAADLDASGRQLVIEHFKKLGFKDRSTTPIAKQIARADPRTRKIWALWLQLKRDGRLAAETENTGRALQRFVHRQTGVEHLDWLSNRQQDDVIEALKQWIKRPDRTVQSGEVQP